MGLHKKMQNKILLALVFLAFIFIGSTLFLKQLYQNNLQLVSQENTLHSLSRSIDSLEKSNQHYINNAPRDYESYNRDLQVFHNTLQQNIGQIEKNISNLDQVSDFANTVDNSISAIFFDSQFMELAKKINLIKVNWLSFKTGLDDKLGPVKNEPRLEWGATYITEQAPTLSLSFSNLINNFDNISIGYKNSSDSLTKTVIISLCVILLLYILWFFFSVIKPIKNTSDAFNRVSNGDYGYQVPNKRGDEIGQLTDSFNSMSSRTQLVLSIISQLQNSNHPAKAVEEFHTLSDSYLKADMAGLLQVNSAFSLAKYSFLSPKEQYKSLIGETANIHAGSDNDLFLSQLNDKKVIRIDNLLTYIKQHADAALLQPLIGNFLMQSAMVIPLESDKWQGILVLTSSQESHFTNAQQELIESMLPLISKGFASATLRAKAFNKIKNSTKK